MTAKYKHLLSSLLAVAIVVVGLLIVAPPTARASALGHNSPSAHAAATTCAKPTFLGLVPWYQYLKLDASCDIKNFMVLPDGSQHSDVPLVVLAIIDDLLRITGLVAVGYVIYGGIQFITSQGSPDGTNKARQTVLNALIGLAIALVAITTVTFIGNKLGGS